MLTGLLSSSSAWLLILKLVKLVPPTEVPTRYQAKESLTNIAIGPSNLYDSSVDTPSS